MRVLCLTTTLALLASAAGSAQIPTPIPDASGTLQSVVDANMLPGIAGLLPIRSEIEAQDFWGRRDENEARFLSSGTVLFSDAALESTLELASDLVGIFRLGLGVTVASPKSEETDSASQAEATEGATLARLANSGGGVHITAALPLYHRIGPSLNSRWALIWSMTGATETPQEGSFLEDPAMTAQTGLEFVYRRQGVDNRIDFHAGLIVRTYWLSEAYAAKASLSKGLAHLMVPRLGFTLIGQTRIDVHWRLFRSSKFEALGNIGVSVQQVTN